MLGYIFLNNNSSRPVEQDVLLVFMLTNMVHITQNQ